MAKRQNIKPESDRADQVKVDKIGFIKSIFPADKEYDIRIISLAGGILSLLLLIFAYKFIGSYFEANDDPRYVMAMKGFASPKPYDNFVSVYKFTVGLYIWLYKHYPSVGWYGYSMFLLLWGALFNTFITLYLLAKKKINILLIVLIFICYYFLVFCQNVFWINFTRPVILGTSSFILLLGALYIHSDIFKRNKWIIILPSVIFAITHFTRLDAGYLGFAFGITATTLIVALHKKVFPFLIRYITPVLVFILVIKLIDYASQKQDPRNQEFLEKTEIIRQVLDYRNASQFVPKSMRDTAANMALMNARYCSDTALMNMDFFKRLISENPADEKSHMEKFDEEYGAFEQSLNAEDFLAFRLNIGLYITLLIWLFLDFKINLRKFSIFLLFQVFFISLLIAMSYYMKLPSRIYGPLFVELTFINIIFFISILHFKRTDLYLLVLVPVVMVIISFKTFLSYYGDFLENSKNYGRIHHRVFNNMNQFTNTIFIPLTLRSWELHFYTDPIKEINFYNNNCYVYLSIELSLAPETQDQLADKFGTADHSKLFQKISSMDNVIFISNEIYNSFLQAYYHHVYKQNYHFEKISDNVFISEATGLIGYRVKKGL